MAGRCWLGSARDGRQVPLTKPSAWRGTRWLPTTSTSRRRPCFSYEPLPSFNPPESSPILRHTDRPPHVLAFVPRSLFLAGVARLPRAQRRLTPCTSPSLTRASPVVSAIWSALFFFLFKSQGCFLTKSPGGWATLLDVRRGQSINSFTLLPQITDAAQIQSLES